MDQDEYNTRLKELQQDLKPSDTRYVPSGRMPPKSGVFLIPISLFVAGACYVAALPIYLFFGALIPPETRELNWQSKDALFGLGVTVVVNVLLAGAVICAAAFSFRFAANRMKLRNPKVVARFAVFSAFVACVFLFLPPLGGDTLLVRFIPDELAWSLAAVACIVIPFLTFRVAINVLYRMKFCEVTGTFLNKQVRAILSLDQAKGVIGALARKQYELISSFLNSKDQPQQQFTVAFTLFGHPEAQVAYIDMLGQFSAVVGGATNATRTSWLVLHQKLQQEDARTILGPVQIR